MRDANYIRILAIFISLLIISIPITFANELSLTYDKNGNLVTGDGKYRIYNSLNQLWKVYNGTDTSGTLLEDYTYHPIEERVLVKKIYNNDSTLKETIYYVSENFVRVTNSSGSYDFTYVKHEGQLIAQQNPDNSKYFIHTDHLGSTSVVTDSSGNVIENTTYSPFGEVLIGGSTSRYQYEAKEFDSIIGDYDFHFRKYKPEWALFTQPDTLIQNVYDPQSLNRYMFERGNPYKYTDPSGHVAKATVNKKSATIKVEAKIIIYGKGASNKKAQQIEKAINKAWSSDKVTIGGTKYSVITNVKVVYSQDKPSKLGQYENSVEIKGFFEGLFTRSSVTNRREGTWSYSSIRQGQYGDSLSAHEGGHLLGLKDRYQDKWGIISESEKGYEDSLMSGGSPTPSNADFRNMLTQSVAQNMNDYSEDLYGNVYSVVDSDETTHTLDYED